MNHRLKLLCVLLLTFLGTQLSADEVSITDAEGNEITVEVYPDDGDLLIIWLVDHDEERPVFENMLQSVHASGTEIWRVDLLDAYFLPRSSEAQRTLTGEGVAALLEAAHRLRNKGILLAAYDRMPLPLLRGIRLWQERKPTRWRLSGAILFYPNLFGPAPAAGEAPLIDPVVAATNIPVVIYQPEIGSQRWRLDQVMSALWQGGSPAFSYLVPGVRDWFFMGESGHSDEDKRATRAIPIQLHNFARLMGSHPRRKAVLPLVGESLLAEQVMDLVPLNGTTRPPGFSLPEMNGDNIDWNDYRGRVTLVNFWATWCPPCVEEVPSLNRLAARYEREPFAVVSIDYRETGRELLEFVQKIPVDFPILLDNDGKVSLNWEVFSFPSSFLIDKNGFLRYSANRAIDWDTEEVHFIVEQLLAE